MAGTVVCLLAGMAPAAVVFDPPRWSPDKPLLRMGSASGQVKLINRGPAPARIVRLTYHGTVYARTGAKSIDPGGSAVVGVWVNAPDTYGPVQGRVEVTFEGLPPATLAVSATVGRASDVGLLPREVATSLYPARQGPPLLVRFYYQPGCEHCAMVLTEVVQPLAKHFGAVAHFDLRAINEVDAFVELQRVKDAYRLTGDAQTYAFCGGRSLVNLGVDDGLYKMVRAELAQPTTTPTIAPAGRVSPSDLGARFADLGPWAALGIGLVDGINPCALATIVFLIALLTRLGHRRRTLAAAGLCYAAAVFVTYTLLGLGLLHALARVDQQLATARTLRLAAALWAAAFALLQVRDVVRLRRGAPTRELSAQLPTGLKQRAHALLRWSTSPRWGWLLVGLATAAAGVGVTLIEMACTSQVYLPVLMLLRSSGWQTRAGGLLLAYNTGFVLPLLAVTALAVVGTGSAALAQFARRHLAACKLALAALLAALAVLLLVH